MIKHRSILFVLTILCFVSCSLDNKRVMSSVCDNLDYNTLLSKSGIESLDDLCYHEGTELVLQPSHFDYTRTGNEPNHRAIKVYPKDISEQQYISSIEDAGISYIPFGFIPAPPNIQTVAKEISIPVYPEVSPYILLNTDNESGPEVVQMPIMYVIWPLNKPFPDNIEYEECFQLYVPIAKEMPEPSTKAEIIQDLYPAHFRTYDGFLGTYLPLNKLSVHITNGYVTGTQYTNSTGRVYIDPFLVGVDPSDYPSMYVYATLNNTKWTIAREAATPIHVSLGYVGVLWPNSFNSGTYTFNMVSTAKEFETHRALDYYHYASNPYSSFIGTNETGVLVHSLFSSMPGVDGKTSFIFGKDVTIYNNAIGCNDVISAVLHELGHIRHKYHHHNNNDNSFGQVDTLLIESYGSFMGWYLGEQYYLSKGYVKTDSTEVINNNWRQDWSPISQTPYYWYSPLFIDLIDDYNQGQNDSTKLYDDINEFGILDIETTISTSNTVSQCKANLFYPLIENKLNAYFSYYGI